MILPLLNAYFYQIEYRLLEVGPKNANTTVRNKISIKPVQVKTSKLVKNKTNKAGLRKARKSLSDYCDLRRKVDTFAIQHFDSLPSQTSL